MFQWGWFDAIIPAPQGDPMLSTLPIILVGVLFGLAMDYQVFLVSRIQEMHNRGASPKDAVIERLRQVRPRSSSRPPRSWPSSSPASPPAPMAVAASIALGLVVGVIVDAFLVRMIIMPAVLSLLGHAAWWLPTWLDRILPHLDTEGHGLGDAHEDAQEERALVNA